MFLLFKAFITEYGKVELQGKPSWITRLHLFSLLNSIIIAFEATLDSLFMAFTFTNFCNISVVIALKLKEIDDTFRCSVALRPRHKVLRNQI